MDRQAIVQRCRDLVTSFRARVSLRLIFRAGLALTALGLVSISAEALIRARIHPPLDRLKSALYTRPTPWGRESESRNPVPIATLDGSALEQRVAVHILEVPEPVIQAVLAVEDQRFYRHHGLDIKRIGGALLANLRTRSISQGGSTITQQLAKNLFLSARRTPLRKLREAALAVVLELRYDKPAILEAYLNEIYLGQDGSRAIHGAGAAARYYFGKDLRRVSLGEAAMLAAMINAPNRNAPNRNPGSARQRRDLVLHLMAEQGRITRQVAERAARTRIGSRVWPARGVDGRYFRDFVSPDAGHNPARGTAVYTTLDATLQRAAERAVSEGLPRLGAPGAEASLVAIDPRNGDVLAMVGGRDYGASQFNRAALALRQPGSAFKPVVALAALERTEGRDPAFTLASVVEDEPLRVRTPNGPWEPSNYDRQFRGRVTVRQAMEYSLNVPFARIGLAIGPDRIVSTARRLGIESPLSPVPSLALGSSEVTLLELVRAYGVLAARGELAQTRAVLSRAPFRDRAPEAASVGTRPVVDPAVAFLVTSTLEGVVQHGTGRALNESGRFEGLAGKTGTSNDWRDAWFVAYTPTLVVGVWVGYDDGRSLHLSGAGAALPIVARFLAGVVEETEWGSFEVPDGITEGYVTLAGEWGSDCGEREFFLAGTEPDGQGCDRWELPSWDSIRELGGQWGRRAAQMIQDLLAEQLHRRRGER